MKKVEILRVDNNGRLWQSWIDEQALEPTYKSMYEPGKDGWRLTQIIGYVPYRIDQGVIIYFYTREVEAEAEVS